MLREIDEIDKLSKGAILCAFGKNTLLEIAWTPHYQFDGWWLTIDVWCLVLSLWYSERMAMAMDIMMRIVMQTKMRMRIMITVMMTRAGQIWSGAIHMLLMKWDFGCVGLFVLECHLIISIIWNQRNSAIDHRFEVELAQKVWDWRCDTVNAIFFDHV